MPLSILRVGLEFAKSQSLRRAPTRGGGHPQGVPLPAVFSQRSALGRAPTRGAPTDCLLSAFGPGEGTHKGCPYRLSSLGVRPWGGHPQGVPLPAVFSRRLALRRAPTRGAPTDCLLSGFGPGEGTHKGCLYRLSSLGVRPWGGRPQGAPLPDCLLAAFGPGEGTHKGRPYLSSLGVRSWGGHPQGAPLPVFSRRFALGRAPTRGAPTGCLLSAFSLEKGAHKGCPYRLSSLGVWPWGGHPQGVPLPAVFSRRSALGRAPTRGAPTRLSSRGVRPWGGHPQGAPLPIVFSRRSALGRAPTRGAPTYCLLSAFGPGEGTHKGRPYLLSSLGVRPWGGHPQGVPLPIVFSRRSALGRAPTRGAPTGCLLSAFCPGEGTHKGCPYRLSSLGVRPWGGHPQGAPLPIVFSRRFALGRAPTRGAPTDCLLSAFGPGEGTHKGCPYRLSSLGVLPWGGHPQGVPLPLGVRPWGGHPQGAPLPIVFSRRSALGRAPTRGAPTGCLLSAFCPGEGTHKGCPYRLSSLGVRPWGGHPQGVPLPAVFSRRFALGRAPTRGAPTSLGVRPWEGHPQGAPLPDSGSLTRFFLI